MRCDVDAHEAGIAGFADRDGVADSHGVSGVGDHARVVGAGRPRVEVAGNLRGEIHGAIAATRKACAAAGVMQQEREFLAALRSATTWAIDARGMLDMHRADGERVLTAGGAFE